VDRDLSVANDEQKRKNLRLALILASIAAVFFLGFVAKMVLLGR
jgi:hypothetical protein